MNLKCCTPNAKALTRWSKALAGWSKDFRGLAMPHGCRTSKFGRLALKIGLSSPCFHTLYPAFASFCPGTIQEPSNGKRNWPLANAIPHWLSLSFASVFKFRGTSFPLAMTIEFSICINYGYSNFTDFESVLSASSRTFGHWETRFLL